LASGKELLRIAVLVVAHPPAAMTPMFSMSPSLMSSATHAFVAVLFHYRTAIAVLAGENNTATADYGKHQDCEYFLQVLFLL
jgi:hypothetical protein